MAILALQEAYEQAGLLPNNACRTALLNATSVGGMCEIEKHYFDMLNNPSAYKYLAETIDCADSTQRLATAFGIKHFLTTISTCNTINP